MNKEQDIKKGCGKFLIGEDHHIGDTYCDGKPFYCKEGLNKIKEKQ